MNSTGEKLKGRVAFITGGASGIGLGIAGRYIREGARTVLFDRNAELLKEVKESLKDNCITVAGDVTKEKDIERAVAEGAKAFGHVDIGINSAGLGTYAYITEQTEEQWDEVINICLKGVFFSIKYEARQMLSQGKGGAIINIASLNSRQPAEGYSAYCSAKAGVEMITKIGAMELGPHKIRVCCISPGAVATPLIAGMGLYPALGEETLDNCPLGRIGTTDDIAGAALFLASDEASWITGETLFVDGGCQTKRYPILSNHIPELKEFMSDKRLKTEG